MILNIIGWLLIIAGVVLVFYEFRHAPLGYQNKDGFHYGKETKSSGRYNDYYNEIKPLDEHEIID